MAGGFLSFFFFFYHQRCLGSLVMPYVLIPSTWISELVAWSAWHPRWRHVLPLDSCFLVSVIADGCAIQETWVWSLGWEDPLEKGMAIQSLQYSCLENPWAEKSGGLQSMGLQRVRHDLETNTFTHVIQSRAKFSSVQLLSCVQHFATPWTAACQASLSITNSWSLLKLYVHWLGDAIQPSHSLLSPSPPAFNLSQHQGLFQRVSSSHQVAKVLEFQLQHQPFQWVFRTDFL